MARYTPGSVFDDLLRLELNKIAQAMETANERLSLEMLHKAPVKYRDGTIVLADGADWKPTGAATPGYYGYYGGAWHFLG